MTRRSRIVSLQAGVVGVLLVVVYLTILRPDDDQPVSGVTAPGAPGAVVNRPADKPRSHHKPPRRPQHPSGQRGPQGSGSGVTGTNAGGAGTPGLAAPGAVPGTPTSAPGGDSPGGGGGGPPAGQPPPPGDDPSDDQYGDTLSRLTAALR